MDSILIEVKPEGLEWGVSINGHCLGTSKSSCDADFHANFLISIMGKTRSCNLIELNTYPQDRERLQQEIEAARKVKK
jgi:hypothetical protein